MADEIRYERLNTPRAMYAVSRNGRHVSFVAKSPRGTWGGVGTHVKVETSGHPSRGEAWAALALMIDAAA